MLGAVCKFNAQLICVSLTWMTDILTITFTFPHGNPIVLPYVYERIHAFALRTCLNTISGTPMLVNMFYALFVYLHIDKVHVRKLVSRMQSSNSSLSEM